MQIEISLNADKAERYEFIKFRGQPDCPYVEYINLSVTQRSKITDEVVLTRDEDGEVSYHQMEGRLTLASKCLVGWGGFTSNGVVVAFPNDGLDALELMPPEYANEIMTVFGGGFLDREVEADLLEAEEKRREKEAKKEAAAV